MIEINGKIKDSKGVVIPFANVYFSDRDGKIMKDHQGAASDEIGEYSIQGNGAYVTASSVGYNNQTKPFARSLDFALDGVIDLKEVEIISTVAKSAIKKINWNYLLILVLFVAVSSYFAIQMK